MGERYLGYLAAWVIADVLAWFVRFGVSAPDRELMPILAVQAGALIGLFLWKDGHRVRKGDLVAVVVGATFVCVVASFLVVGDVSRLLLTLQLAFGIGALLAARRAMSWMAERR
jgi:Na+/melibiose symporter-like transporter